MKAGAQEDAGRCAVCNARITWFGASVCQPGVYTCSSCGARYSFKVAPVLKALWWGLLTAEALTILLVLPFIFALDVRLFLAAASSFIAIAYLMDFAGTRHALHNRLVPLPDKATFKGSPSFWRSFRLLTPVIYFGVFLLGLTMARLGGATELAALEQAHAARGYPLSLEALEEYLEPERGTGDATAILGETFSAMRECGLIDAADTSTAAQAVIDIVEKDAGSVAYLHSQLRALPLNEIAPDALLKAISELVGRSGPVFAALPSPEAIAIVRFPVTIQEHGEHASPHMQPLRELSRLLVLRAAVQVSEGRGEFAIRDIVSGIALIDSIRNDPFAFNTAMAIHEHQLRALEWTMCREPLPPELLIEAQQAFARLSHKQLLEGAIAGLTGAAYAHLLAEELPFLFYPDMDYSPTGGFARLNRLTFLTPGAILLANIDSDWHVLLRLARELPAATLRESPLARAYQEWIQAEQVAAFFAQRTVQAAQAATGARLVKAAALVEQHRASAGALPDSLQALPPALREEWPADPFNGLPLRFRRLEKGYLIYSDAQDTENHLLKGDTGDEPATLHIRVLI